MFNTKAYGGMNALLSEGFLPTRELSASTWNRPLSEEVEAAWTLQLDYVARLLEAVSRGNIDANRERQNYLLGRSEFQGHSRAHAILQEAHVHSTADFVNLTAAVANRRLVSLWNQRRDRSNWPNYVYVAPDRESCDEMGTISVYPVSSGTTSGQPLSEGGTFTYWRFGERIRGKYGVHIYADAFAWTWKLAMCDKYGGLGEVLPWLVRKQFERKEMFATQLHVGEQGPHSAVYNQQYNNILPDNPALSFSALEAAFPYIAKQKDDEGELIDVGGRQWVLVVGSYLLKQQIEMVLGMSQLRIAGINNQGSPITQITTSPLPNLTVVYNQFIQKVATALHPLGGTYADHSWFLFPSPTAGDKNPLEIAHLQGYRDSRLFRKAGNTATLGGSVIQGLGDFHTMDQEVKAVQSYGGGVMWPEWTFASNGTTPDPAP